MSTATVMSSAPAVQRPPMDLDAWLRRTEALAQCVLGGHPTHVTEAVSCPCGQVCEKTECRFFPLAIAVLKLIREQREHPRRTVTIHAAAGAYGGYAHLEERELPDIVFDVPRLRLTEALESAGVIPMPSWSADEPPKGPHARPAVTPLARTGAA